MRVEGVECTRSSRPWTMPRGCPKPLERERGGERDNRLQVLRAARANTVVYIGGCDQEHGVIESGFGTYTLFSPVDHAERLCEETRRVTGVLAPLPRDIQP